MTSASEALPCTALLFDLVRTPSDATGHHESVSTWSAEDSESIPRRTVPVVVVGPHPLHLQCYRAPHACRRPRAWGAPSPRCVPDTPWLTDRGHSCDKREQCPPCARRPDHLQVTGFLPLGGSTVWLSFHAKYGCPRAGTGIGNAQKWW